MDTQTAPVDAQSIVTHESSTGHTLTGVGVTAESLADVADRHEPAESLPTETTTTAPPATAAQGEPPKPSRGQARFSELTKARKEAEARAATLERELATYRSQAPTAPAAATTAPVAPQMLPPSPSGPERGDSGRPSGRPQPSENDIGTQYQTYADFVVDSARWVAEQQQSDIDARIRRGIEEDRATRDFLGHAERTWAKGRTVYADFDALRMHGPGAQVPMSSEKIAAIIHHPASEHMQVVIAKDAALAQRLAQMGPIEFGMAMASFAPPGGVAPLASTSAAGSVTPPAPMQPVGSGSPTTPTPSADHAKKGDYHAYKARREAEQKARR